MKLEVYREVQFSSAHRLRNYHGKCENMHGHNWRVRLFVTRNQLDETGFVMDFKVLDAVLKKIMELLDHKDLNSLKEFETVNPTAENIALLIFRLAEQEISAIDKEVKVSKVSVWESDKSCAIVEA
ncbi:6-carboxytetrahydropterin synthase QueD [bacterium]|nr:6-carboxytetrahydropterin synthase QueD [bacterium]MBQ4438805.1 6-carboxytetrahydropterin synthase QueD [bacterium]